MSQIRPVFFDGAALPIDPTAVAGGGGFNPQPSRESKLSFIAALLPVCSTRVGCLRCPTSASWVTCHHDSSIEKAAQRLEQLRKAGVPVPGNVVRHEEIPAPSAEQQSAKVSPAEDVVIDVQRGVPASPPASKSVHIDLTALAAAGFVTPNAPRSATTDQFRVIKRPLLENATGKGASLVANGNPTGDRYPGGQDLRRSTLP
jgi:hypothetical protein